MYEYTEDYVCTIKFSVYLNSDGNIVQGDETPAGQKNITINGVNSTITAAETVNDENSPALHNGVAGFMWLFTGQDDNFDPLSIKKISTEMIDSE